MRVPTPLSLLAPLLLLPLLPLSLAADSARWSAIASKSKDGVIKLNSETYDELLAADRDYSALVVLTALPQQFKCQPCQ